jgi:SOS-response transcriptional repressor LexA
MGRPRARMTKRWELVLGFIKAYQRIHGVPPSYEIMARGLGMVAKSNVYRMVKRLEAEGLLETKRRKILSIRVVDKSVEEIGSL